MRDEFRVLGLRATLGLFLLSKNKLVSSTKSTSSLLRPALSPLLFPAITQAVVHADSWL